MKIELPIYLPSVANLREHWSKRAKRAKAHRLEAGLTVAGLLTRDQKEASVIITITRIGRRLLDDDNLRSCAKNVRDGIADAFGANDRDPRLTWKYAQEKVSAPKSKSDIQVGRVRIEIEFLT